MYLLEEIDLLVGSVLLIKFKLNIVSVGLGSQVLGTDEVFHSCERKIITFTAVVRS